MGVFARAARFFGHDRGNIGMMFGLLLIPIILAVGAGVDMSRAWFARTTMMEAADAAVLGAARAIIADRNLSDAEAAAVARRYFDAHAGKFAELIINDFQFEQDAAAERYRVTVDADLPATFMSVVGRQLIPVGVLSEATAAPPRPLETMLVLDTTWSMEGDRLTALKSAATDLAEMLLNSDRDTIKVGVVPFGNYVNVGVSRRSEPWIDVPADYSETELSCRDTFPNRTESNCRTVSGTCTETETYNCRSVPRECTRTRDGRTTTYACPEQVCSERTRSGPCDRRECDVDDGAPVRVCDTNVIWHRFHGCVGSRNHPLDVEDRDFTIQRVPGLMDLHCGSEILPLSASLSDVRARIDGLSPDGETYIPAGLTWGLRLLSPQAPFTEGRSFANRDDGMKALVLMTDGVNTKSASYPRHDGSSRSAADDLTEELCEEAEAAGVVMLTIAFEVTDNSVKDLLRNCAAEDDYYFDASDADKLAEAFEQIGFALQDLSLAR